MANSTSKGKRKLNIIKSRHLVHKLRMLEHISKEEILDAFYNSEINTEDIFGIPYRYDGPDYLQRWVDQVYNKVNSVINK